MKFIFRLEVKISVSFISVSFLPGTGVRGGSDAETVVGAWDFAQINRRYARHREVLGRCPAGEELDETLEPHLLNFEPGRHARPPTRPQTCSFNFSAAGCPYFAAAQMNQNASMTL